MGIFDGLDFNHLPEGFQEDSVREDIITQLLKCLGYSSTDSKNQIIRSPHLEHPFTQFGTKSAKNKLIPDYLVRAGGVNAFIMEAKAPNVDILKGKSVEQAYSYAINRNVRTKRFALCNGRQISIFDVDRLSPILFFQLGDASKENWEMVFELLSPAAFTNPNIFQYKLDYGIWCFNNGIQPGVPQYFYDCHITDVARLDDNMFTFMAVIQREVELLASFDFHIVLFESFMQQLPLSIRKRVRDSIRRSPFRYQAQKADESFSLSFEAVLSEQVEENRNEQYIPLQIKRFL